VASEQYGASREQQSNTGVDGLGPCCSPSTVH
jgi:hypothetical protein